MSRLAPIAAGLVLAIFATTSIGRAADRRRQTAEQNAQRQAQLRAQLLRDHFANRQPSVRSTSQDHGRRFPLGGTASNGRRFPLGGSASNGGRFSLGGSSQHTHHHGATYRGNYRYSGYRNGGYYRPAYILPAQNYVFVPGRGFVPVLVNYGYGY